MGRQSHDRRRISDGRVENDYGRKQGKGKGGWEPFNVDTQYERTAGGEAKRSTQPTTRSTMTDSCRANEIHTYRLSTDPIDVALNDRTLNNHWDSSSTEENEEDAIARTYLLQISSNEEFPSLPPSPQISAGKMFPTPRNSDASNSQPQTSTKPLNSRSRKAASAHPVSHVDETLTELTT